MRNFIIVVVVVTLALVGGIFAGSNWLSREKQPQQVGMVGKQAPDFELKDYQGNTVKLSNLRGKTILLFFNEGLMCYPACWDQIKALGEDERFSAAGIEVYSVIVDVPDNWKKALEKMPALAKARVLFDTTKTASAEYETLYASSSMHKGGYPGHTYVLIDKDGKVSYWFDDPQMGIRNDKILSEVNKQG